MKVIAGGPGRIVRAAFLALALSAPAACSVVDDGTPGLRIKGSIATQYGRAKNCVLRLTDLQGARLATYDVGSSFSVNWTSRYYYDADREAYPGVQIEITCDDDLSATRTIGDEQMVARNSNIDLGKIIVQ